MPAVDFTSSKYKAEDFPAYYAMVREYAVMRYITEKGLNEAEAQQKFEQMIQINTAYKRIGYFKVYDAERVFIGDCKLEPFPQDASCFEVGYILKEQAWGKGYATALCKEMLRLAKHVNAQADIVAIIDPANIASRKILEKMGFKSYFLGIEDNLPTEKWRLAAEHSSA